MANKNNTREGIHSGLSQSKSDEKWADMLNFRSSDNRTFVVPRKYKLYDKDTVFHTIVRGVGDLVYAFGDRFSGLFRGNESSGLGQLWRARVTRLVTNEDQSENLKLRGSYLGSEPLELRLTVVNGKLVSDANWPEVVEEVVEVEQASSLNCGVVTNYPQLDITVRFLPRAAQWQVDYESYAVRDVVLSVVENPPFVAGASVVCYCVESHVTFDDYNYTSFISNLHPPVTGKKWVKVVPWLEGVTGGAEGNLVYRGGNIWKCIIDHFPYDEPVVEDSFPGTGVNSAAYWVLLATMPSTVAAFLIAPPYVTGTRVSHNGLVYVANTTHTPSYSNRPGVGSVWTLYTPTPLPASGADVSIYQGRDLVQIYRTNAAGLLTVPLIPNPYRIQITRDDFELKEVTFLKTSDDQAVTITAQQV